jgi:hypothetical protein
MKTAKTLIIQITNTKKYKFVVKISITDFNSFNNPTKIMQEIERLKGKELKIENAFILNKNNLLYLFTNDQDTYDRLNENWQLMELTQK